MLLQSCGWLPAQGQAQRSFPAASRGTSPVSSGPSASAGQPLHVSQNGGHAPSAHTGQARKDVNAVGVLSSLPEAAGLRGVAEAAQLDSAGLLRQAVRA